jgi:voltage-gated potassium channel
MTHTMKIIRPPSRFKRFVRDVFLHTPFVKIVLLLVVPWLVFSTGLYLPERNVEGAAVDSYREALYWGIAAFSTAGIADTPESGTGQLVGGFWIIIGSVLFFGAIVATVTAYFMRPIQRPYRRIIDAIEYNLEQMEDLSPNEIELLKETVDTLIDHVENTEQEKIKRVVAIWLCGYWQIRDALMLSGGWQRV